MKIKVAFLAVLLLAVGHGRTRAFELPSTKKARLEGEQKAREVAQALMGDREREKVRECIRKFPDADPRPSAKINSQSTHFGMVVTSFVVTCGSGSDPVVVIWRDAFEMKRMGFPLHSEERIWTLDQVDAALQSAFTVERNRAKAATLPALP